MGHRAPLGRLAKYTGLLDRDPWKSQDNVEARWIEHHCGDRLTIEMTGRIVIDSGRIRG